MWTGEFDLKTLRVDGKIFESGKKKLRIQKYPDTCGRGLRPHVRVNQCGLKLRALNNSLSHEVRDVLN